MADTEGMNTDASYFAAAGALQAGAYGLSLLTSKATLYVRLMNGPGVDTTGSAVNEDVSSLRSLLKKRNKTSESIASRAGQVVTSASLTAKAVQAKMSSAEMGAAMLSKGFLPMEVQYNPSSLQMNTVGGTIRKYSAMGNESMGAITSSDEPTSTFLSVQLVFEDINLADAFGSSSLALNADAAVDMAASTIKNFLGDGYSVKKPVEGLISLLMLKQTRQVIFCWNDMFFHGELIRVDANFTMFNKLGHPIRATVDLSIQQTDSNAAFVSDKQYWDDAFDAAFASKSLI